MKYIWTDVSWGDSNDKFKYHCFCGFKIVFLVFFKLDKIFKFDLFEGDHSVTLSILDHPSTPDWRILLFKTENIQIFKMESSNTYLLSPEGYTDSSFRSVYDT